MVVLKAMRGFVGRIVRAIIGFPKQFWAGGSNLIDAIAMVILATIVLGLIVLASMRLDTAKDLCVELGYDDAASFGLDDGIPTMCIDRVEVDRATIERLLDRDTE